MILQNLSTLAVNIFINFKIIFRKTSRQTAFLKDLDSKHFEKEIAEKQ